MRNTLSAVVVLAGLFGLGTTSAQAATRFWYDQVVNEINVGDRNIDSESPVTPHILNTVVARCPAAGKLVANADASFGITFDVDDVGNYMALYYGISVNTMEWEYGHAGFLQAYGDGVNSHWSPAHSSRVYECTAGEEVTFRFWAFRSTAPLPAPSASFFNPRLMVEFIR